MLTKKSFGKEDGLPPLGYGQCMHSYITWTRVFEVPLSYMFMYFRCVCRALRGLGALPLVYLFVLSFWKKLEKNTFLIQLQGKLSQYSEELPFLNGEINLFNW